jgi:hypothetical protein
MDREKDIEVMAKDIAISRGYGCDNRDHCDMSCQNFKCGCIPYECAEILYNADYRKQEWISVDERLPEPNTWVTVYNPKGEYTRIDTDEIVGGNWVRNCGKVTHWMPLPKPPKGE